MFCQRLVSSTTWSGQVRAISSSLLTTFPACSHRTARVATTLAPTGCGSPACEMTPFSASMRSGPTSKITSKPFLNNPRAKVFYSVRSPRRAVRLFPSHWRRSTLMKNVLGLLTLALAGATAISCGGGGSTPGPGPSPTPSMKPALYQPLAVGDTWNYTCGPHPAREGAVRTAATTFPVSDTVTQSIMVNGVTTFALTLQIPDSSGTVNTLTELLANDAQGNTSIYGYLNGSTVNAITPAVIVGAHPAVNEAFNYTGPSGSTVPRVLQGFDSSNPTGLGTFPTVAVYYENGGTTDNYGYVPGIGQVEQDHANFMFDCVIESFHLN